MVPSQVCVVESAWPICGWPDTFPTARSMRRREAHLTMHVEAVLRFVARQFAAVESIVKFLLVGVVNTLVGLGVIWITKEMLGASDTAGNLTGYTVGVTVSFLLNKQWTFRFRGDRGASLPRFLAVFVISYSANLATVLSLVRLTSLDSFLCQAAGTVPYSALFYLGCRWYAFPGSRGRSPEAGSAA